MIQMHHIPKAPRWIVTEAGQWAWSENSDWRKVASNALSVEQRKDLLSQAESLHQQIHPAPGSKTEITLLS